jgi:hypothetical protein
VLSIVIAVFMSACSATHRDHASSSTATSSPPTTAIAPTSAPAGSGAVTTTTVPETTTAAGAASVRGPSPAPPDRLTLEVNYGRSGGDPGTTRFDMFATDEPRDFADHVRTRVEYGDGDYSDRFFDSETSPPAHGEQQSHACTSLDSGGFYHYAGQRRIEFASEHAYRRPGRYTLHLLVESGAGARSEQAVFDKTVVIAPKRVQSNGPQGPTDADVPSFQSRDGGNHTFVWDPMLCDPDGWLLDAVRL